MQVKAPGQPIPITIQAITVNKVTAQFGEELIWTMTTMGGQAPLRYNYTIYNQDGVPVHVGAQSTSNTIAYMPTAPGYYAAVGVVQDAQGGLAQMEGGIAQVEQAAPLTIQHIALDKTGTVMAGEIQIWTIAASGGKVPLKYGFSVYRDGEQINVDYPSSSPVLSGLLTKPGRYWVVGTVTDANQTVVTQASEAILVTEGIRATNPDETLRLGDSITWKTLLDTDVEGVTYTYLLRVSGARRKIEEDSPSSTFTYTTTAVGLHRVEVTTKVNGRILSTVGSEYSLVLPQEAAISLRTRAYDEGPAITIRGTGYLGVSGCRIFRSEYGVPNSRVLLANKSFSSGNFDFTDIMEKDAEGKVYMYSVQPYVMVNLGRADGVESDVFYAFASAKPTRMAANRYMPSPEISILQLQWVSVPNAHGYVVDRRAFRPSGEVYETERIVTTESKAQWSLATHDEYQQFEITPFVDLPGGIRVTGGMAVAGCAPILINAPHKLHLSRKAPHLCWCKGSH